MTFYNTLLLIVVYTASVSCHSTFVDTLPKCTTWDYECQKNVMQSLLRNVGSTGIQDLDINCIDPLDIKGLHIPVYGLFDIYITEGNVKGIKGCSILKYITNFDLGQVSVETVCDILVEGKYTAAAYNPLVNIFVGKETLHGEGSGRVEIEKLKISADYPFELVKRDHDYYINNQLEKGNISFDILGKVQFYADKGVENDYASEILVRLLNENWKVVMDVIWNIIKEVATGYINDFNNKFFINVPLKYFIAQDLPSHIHV